MRRLEVTVAIDHSEKVEESLDRMELLYSSSTVEIGNKSCMLYVSLVPDQLVDEAVGEISQTSSQLTI